MDTSDGSGQWKERKMLQERINGRSDGCYKRSIEGAMDGCKRCIIEQSKDRWIVQAIDQGALEGAIDATSDGSGNN